MRRTSIHTKIILAALFLLSGINVIAQEQLYVDETATGINNGASWKDAYKKITDAIASAEANSTIHIAKGTYTGILSSTAITIDKSLTLIGGYPTGGGIANHFENKTILDGSKKRRVVNITKASTLIGLIIQNGKETDYDGAGLRIASSSTLEDCIIRDNHTSKSFEGEVKGGGIYAAFNLKMINCKVVSNTVSSTSSDMNLVKGGGVFIRGVLNATNTLFLKNNSTSISGDAFGAGVYASKQVDLINCLLTRNFAKSNNKALGAGIYASGTKGSSSRAIRFKNTILWENMVSSNGGQTIIPNEYSINGPSENYFSAVNSLVKGESLEGYGNINDASNSINPYFANPTYEDFRLTSKSPLLDKGKEKYNKASTDLAGNRRVSGKIDIGPYESK
ncbi:MAG: choice-of-anchor Q domain-containing protein [Polaribacter sp.]|nr:choice-of-anchor Q domain-containing protein [Polaribacter sp.]